MTATRPPNGPTLGLVAAEPAPQGEVAIGADEAATARVDRPTDEALSEIHDQIATALATLNNGDRALASNIQRELAHLLALLPHVAASGDHLLIGSVRLALASLLGSHPNVVFARNTRLHVAQRLGIYPSLRWALMSSPIPAVRVMTGLLIVVALAIPLAALTVFLLRAHLEHLNSPTLDLDDFILFGIVGAAGSVVSIMVRIDEFNRWPPDPSILFFTGLFKPIIGYFFAIFVVLVLNSGIMQVGLAEERQIYFFMATSFIAGFSERLARDIATQTESLFPGAAGQPAAPTSEQPAESRR